MGAVRNSARSGSTGLATPASCLLRSPPVLRVPAYRLALRVGSVATPRVIMQAVFPWRQGMPHGDIIASVLSFPNLNGYHKKFSGQHPLTDLSWHNEWGKC